MRWNEGFSPCWCLYVPVGSVRRLLYLVLWLCWSCLCQCWYHVHAGTLWSQHLSLELWAGAAAGPWMKFLLRRDRHFDFICGAMCRTKGTWEGMLIPWRFVFESIALTHWVRWFWGSDWRPVPRHTKAPCCNLVVSSHSDPPIFNFLNYAALVCGFGKDVNGTLFSGLISLTFLSLVFFWGEITLLCFSYLQQ